jgi:two-component system chemotaxis response regulator CheY
MKICVLSVDDSEIMRKQTKAAFAGFAKEAFNDSNVDSYFFEASNGKEALLMLKQKPVNLVLLDWTMPELSGIDFLKAIRSIEAYKTLPVIMITGIKAKTNVIEALKYGVTDYMVKPIDRQLFNEKLFAIFNIYRPNGKK